MRWGWLTLTSLAATTILAGCGDTEPTTSEAAAAETAETVCTTLRRWNNEMTDAINATSQSITDDDDPDAAVGALVAGFDELIEIAGSHRDDVDHLDLPAIDERDALLDELADGAEESIAVLEEERAEAAELAAIELADQRGALGGAFVGVERATSALEPAIGSYDDEALREAFAADEGCEHVIQPF
jgi:hypothetical protein